MTPEIVNNQSDSPIALDSQTKRVYEIALKASNTGASVLIMGETGVGKEMVARYIHANSIYRNGPFVSVNCASIPDSMVEAMLFGYEKGAFTSSISSHVGKFEAAQNGTLLLDEISEMPLVMQPKLLRVLQEREIERLGGKKIININVRIIAATNRHLQDQVNKGEFRSDLFYRLNVVPIHIPALRERVLDIVPLAEYFLKKYAKEYELALPSLTEQAKDKLNAYTWPGNIRELENVIQRALIMTEAKTINHDEIDLPEDHHSKLDSKLKESEAKIIMDALKESGGKKTIAAEKLKMSPRTLRYKLSKLKLVGIEF
jgi:two-component system response regulator FlrC